MTQHDDPPYALLAIDIDGTLTGRNGSLSQANREAIVRARDAGIVVTLCTGRGLVECMHVVRAIEQVEPVIVAGGAIVADPATARTLHRFPMHDDLVRELTDDLLEHGHAVLVLKDPHAAGFDYLVVHEEGEAGLDPVTSWWFREMKPLVRFARSLDEDEHPEHTVRLGVCGTKGGTAPAAEAVIRAYDGRAMFHHFGAVSPEGTRGRADETVFILEAFDRDANKWSALTRLASELAIDPANICAIGDEINDVAMIQGAGLGIAMGNAIDEVRAVADHVTAPNTDDGVALAIDRILDGTW